MKYNTIIIGGGLSGLVAGISLAGRGKSVAIISSGQSALHFSSGSFGLLGRTPDGHAVERPLEAIGRLPATHPYNIMGTGLVSELAAGVPELFARAGITLKGQVSRNHLRLSPFGRCCPTWLTMADFITCDGPERNDIKKVAIVNLRGFLDFYPGYLVDGLASHGIGCTVDTVTTGELERLRRSSTEMRPSTIARHLVGDELVRFAAELNRVSGAADAVLIPAVIGFDSENERVEVRGMVSRPVYCVATTPMSVCGLRAQMMLRDYFEHLGGTYLLGDNVEKGNFGADGRLESIHTVNMGDDMLAADDFILAAGGIFSRGLVADPQHICEPLFGLDVDAPEDREQWYSRDFFARQPYMTYGVVTDTSFRPSRKGVTVPNLRAIGSVLSGYDPLAEDSGAGVAILTALAVTQDRER